MVANKKKELTYEQRLEIVFYHNNGKSYREISNIIGCSKSAAFDVCKGFEKTRSVKNLPRSGRPRTLATPRAERSVITELRQNRFASLRKIATNVRRKLNFEKLSVNIARKVIKKYKYASCIRKKRTCITPINRRRRLAWVKAVTPWSVEDWEDVVFSDECRFALNSSDCGRLRVWRQPSERNDPRFVQPVFMNGPSVMVWGCITAAGVGKLAVVDGTINAAKYCTILDENLLPSIRKCFGNENAPFIFQHDNASPHAARYTMIYIQLRQIQRIRWPSQSPDLNPIENVWVT